MSERILIVEDDPDIVRVVEAYLQREGFVTHVAGDGAAGLAAALATPPALIVLDWMLPQLDGAAFMRRLRPVQNTPVVMLTARGDETDRLQGFALGVDDYLPKPFHLPEFLLRVENLLRRGRVPASALERADTPTDALHFGGHRVDFRRWTATLSGGRQEPLGERELKILRLLSERRGEVVSRDDILDAVWGDDAFPSSRTVDNFVVRLRRLFEPDPAEPRYFHTVWGVGYRFTPEGVLAEVR